MDENYIPQPGDIVDGDVLGEDGFWREAPKGYAMEGLAETPGNQEILQPIDIVHVSEENGDIYPQRKGSKKFLYVISSIIIVVILIVAVIIIIAFTSLGKNVDDAGKSHTGVTDVTNAANTLSLAMINGDVPQGTYLAGQKISFPDSDGSTTVVTVPANGKIVINNQGFTVCGGDINDLYQVNENETTPQPVKQC